RPEIAVALALRRHGLATGRRRMTRLRVNWAQLGLLLLVAGLGFYVIYPLLLILLNSLNTARVGQPAAYGLENWRVAWTSSGIGQALVNTLALAACYQAFSLAVAVGLAWVLARTNVPAARQLEFVFWLSMFIPTLSTTLGWMLLLDPHTGLI